jgi:hypothetical protein
MASNRNGSGTAPLFGISTNTPQVVLDSQRTSQVEFQVEYLGSDSHPPVEARLVVAPQRTWIQSLKVRFFKGDRFPSAKIDWLNLSDRKLNTSLWIPGQTDTINVFIRIPPDVRPDDYLFRLTLVGERERILAQSDWVTIQVKSRPFNIKLIEPGLQPFTLFWNRQKECQFQVFNTSEAPLQGRVRLTPHLLTPPRSLFSLPGRKPEVTWLRTPDLAEQDYAYPDKTGHPYRVHLDVPRQAPPGLYGFSLDVAVADNPDEYFTLGPQVTFRIPAFPWALAFTLAALLLLSIGIWALRLPHIEVAPVQITYSTTARDRRNVVKETERTHPAASPVTIAAGSDFAYTITVTNTKGWFGRRPAGRDDVGEVRVDFPGGVNYIGSSNASCTNKPGSTQSCHLPNQVSIPSGESYTFSVFGRIDPAVENGRVVTNTLQVGKHPPEVYPMNISRRSGLNLTWDPPQSANQDQELVYTLTLNNLGPSQSDQPTLSIKPISSSGGYVNFMSVKVQPETECYASQYVQCQWNRLALDSSAVVTITVIPGPDAAGTYTNTVTLSDEDSLPIFYTELLTVNPAHGLQVDLSAETDGIAETNTPLTYTIIATNTMDAEVLKGQDVKVVFTLPEQLVNPVSLTDIRLKRGSNGPVESPKECWLGIRQTSISTTKYVQCDIKQMGESETVTITVNTLPTKPDIYHSYVKVDNSLGFWTAEKESTLVVASSEINDFALRFDGSTFLTATLSDPETIGAVFTGTLQARFFYDGKSTGNILSLGEGGNSSSGLSIRVQPGILTLGNKDNAQLCFLNIPKDSSGEWITVELTAVQGIPVSSYVTIGDAEKEECFDLPVETPNPSGSESANIPQSLALMIGGSGGGGEDPYKGALDYVRLATPEGTLINTFLHEWKFGQKTCDGNSCIITDTGTGKNSQEIELSPGTWAWVPAQGTVLMPEVIVSDSTWKANYADAAGSDWNKLEANDKNWPFAWDIPKPDAWILSPNSEARWIWAAQPFTDSRYCWKYDCNWLGFNCKWNCTDLLASSNVVFRKIISLRGNPVTATIQIAGDDFYILHVNQNRVDEVKCLQGPCYKDLKSFPLVGLHTGDNLIAIQGTNQGGSGGLLVILSVDYYETITVK